MKLFQSSWFLLATVATAAACSQPADDDIGKDAPLTGGSSATGGLTSAGGAGVGGTVGSGGSLSSGGAVSSSGGATTGGVSAVGGTAATGGAGVGGADGSGGEGAGGSPSSGGDGTGGSEPIVELELVTSAPNNPWKEAPLMPSSGQATITVNDSQVLGAWRGFGGTFNEKGWAALKTLSEEDRARAMRLLFDRADGAAFTYGRIPIGSSDYALSRYSLNETANDFEMNSFSIERDKMDLIPYIQAALAVQPNIHFWASPWSPPTWMKSNGAFDKGNMKEDGQTLDAHALYLAKFVEAYEAEGIFVEAVHPQNEPGYLQDYPSCGWSGGLMTKYIRDHLGPLFAERLPDREVWLGTMSNPSSKSIVDTVMADGGAAAYVKGIGVQWSQDQYVPGYVSSYGVPVMQTEHRCGNFPANGDLNPGPAPNDDAYARESWGYIAHYIRQGVSHYMAWNMVLDPGGRNLDQVRPWAQNALLVAGGNSLTVTPTYYVFRHVAQYVDEDSSRVGVQGGDSLAWKNPDGDIVVVMHNNQNSPKVETVAVGGSSYEVTIPGQGWATVNWQAP